MDGRTWMDGHLSRDRSHRYKHLAEADAHSLAPTLIVPDTHLWTGDKQLQNIANELDIEYSSDEPFNETS